MVLGIKCRRYKMERQHRAASNVGVTAKDN